VALASSAPLSSGLIAGIIGGVIVGFFSNSNVSVSGPAAGLTVIIAVAISDLGSFNVLTLSVFLAGLLQIIFGLTKGGVIGNYFPTSVIKGMLAAIGLILILKQFPHFIGYDADFMGDESFFQPDGQNTFTEILIALKSVHLGATLVAILAVLIMIYWEKGVAKGKAIFQMIPGALIAVISSILVNELFKFISPSLTIESTHLVQLPDFMAGFSLPDWSALSNPKVYSTAFVLAIVASIETLLSIEAADKIDEQRRVTSKNRELFAQGIGNSISGLVGGLPVTAVIVRSSANANSGAKTKLSAILHGFWLLICIVAIPSVLNLIPLSCLAAVLILVGYKLTKPEIIKKMWAKGHDQFFPFMITILAILFTDLLVGIVIGMLVGFFYVIKSSIHKSIVMVRDGNDFLIRFYKDVSFLHKRVLLEMMEEIPSGSSVIIDGSKNVFVDNDIVDLIEEFILRSNSNDVRVELKKSTSALCPIFKEESYG
jgi:MFS superfamily sulfate permease-like transporter